MSLATFIYPHQLLSTRVADLTHAFLLDSNRIDSLTRHLSDIYDRTQSPFEGQMRTLAAHQLDSNAACWSLVISAGLCSPQPEMDIGVTWLELGHGND